MNPTAATAADIARAVSGGEVSAAEVVSAHLDRIAASGLNAFTLVEAEAAAARAAELDLQIARGEDPGPLAGVPIALKDLIDHAGRPTTCGSSFLRDPARETASCVSRLEEAGAVIVGRAGLHEFAFGFSSENDWFGPVHNPWDPATSPGGSSGGSGAAVAAGLAPLGIGTDTGGSVRVPAALCGVVGLKVSHGRIPLHGVFPLAPSLDTVGPLARSVGDAAIAYAVLAGPDPRDPLSAEAPVRLPRGPADLAGLRVAVPLPWAGTPAAPGVTAGFEWALAALERAGAAVDRVAVPDLAEPWGLEPAMYLEIAAVHRAWFEADPDRFGPEVRRRLEDALAVPAEDGPAARESRARIREVAAALLEHYEVLATPATAALRKVIGERTVATAAGATGYRRALSAFTHPVNHLGFPALALPLTGPAAAPGPPPSLQLVGPRWGEHRLLEIGLALEEAGITGFRPPPEG